MTLGNTKLNTNNTEYVYMYVSVSTEHYFDLKTVNTPLYIMYHSFPIKLTNIITNVYT